VRLSAERRGCARLGAAECELRLSAFRLRHFLSFFRSCPSVIRAEAALANASTGIGLLRLGMEHRMKSVATVHDTGVP
jgi:hypothetical protein